MAGSVLIWGAFSLHNRTPLYYPIQDSLSGLRYGDEILIPLALRVTGCFLRNPTSPDTGAELLPVAVGGPATEWTGLRIE